MRSSPHTGSRDKSPSDITVEIYPAFDPKYYSLYIQGLLSLLGPSRLTFTTRGFPRFGVDCLALRVEGDQRSKIYIHSNDMPELDAQGLAWCDVFGKVNLDAQLVPEAARSKVMALGPTMAVRVWGPVKAHIVAMGNVWRSGAAVPRRRKHVGSYRGHYASRFPEESYRPGVSRSDYIFYNAALWEREPVANTFRARFIQACRTVNDVTFEGGLTPRQSARGVRNYSAAEFEPYLCRRYSPCEYLELTKLSAIAMNNPAYRDCHSWRLAEYLSMGKAIVSLPIVRSLPAPLEHGVHIHYVDGSVESFRSAIQLIVSDDVYRSRLEHNAREYYVKYLSSTSVMRRVFEKAGIAGFDGTEGAAAERISSATNVVFGDPE